MIKVWSWYKSIARWPASTRTVSTSQARQEHTGYLDWQTTPTDKSVAAAARLEGACDATRNRELSWPLCKAQEADPRLSAFGQHRQDASRLHGEHNFLQKREVSYCSLDDNMQHTHSHIHTQTHSLTHSVTHSHHTHAPSRLLIRNRTDTHAHSESLLHTVICANSAPIHSQDNDRHNRENSLTLQPCPSGPAAEGCCCTSSTPSQNHRIDAPHTHAASLRGTLLQARTHNTHTNHTTARVSQKMRMRRQKHTDLTRYTGIGSTETTCSELPKL